MLEMDKNIQSIILRNTKVMEQKSILKIWKSLANARFIEKVL
jgi:hypothetical protein